MRSVAKTILVPGLLAAGLSFAAAPPEANVQLTMLTKVNPQATAVWNLTNDAQDDAGNIDPKKIDAATWAKLMDAARALEEGGRAMATATRLVAAPPGAKLQDEGGPGASKAADVQRYIDAKPAEFRKHSAALQKTGADLATAITRRDGRKLTDLSNSLDQVCEECHVAFWYPQQATPK